MLVQILRFFRKTKDELFLEKNKYNWYDQH